LLSVFVLEPDPEEVSAFVSVFVLPDSVAVDDPRLSVR
jgi:hypothetical protein